MAKERTNRGSTCVCVARQGILQGKVNVRPVQLFAIVRRRFSRVGKNSLEQIRFALVCVCVLARQREKEGRGRECKREQKRKR